MKNLLHLAASPVEFPRDFGESDRVLAAPVLVGERPCLQIGPIGSRHDHMAAFITDAGVYVRAGCFWDTLDAFRRAVAETHGGGLHAREYHSAIALVETHAELWTPAPAELTPAEPTEVQA